MNEQYRQEIDEIKRQINSAKYSDALNRLEVLLNGCKGYLELAEIYYYSAICLHSLRTDFKRALYYYDLALKNGYEEFRVRYNRGAVYRKLQNIEAARIDLDRAVALNPTHEGARQLRNSIEIDEIKRYVNTGKYRDALNRLELLLIDPKGYLELAEIYYSTALCLHRLNIDFKRALYYYDLALKNGYEEFWVHYSRSSLYADLGDIEAARIDLDRAVALNSSHEGANRFRNDLFLSRPLDDYQQQISLQSPVVVCCVGKSGTVLLWNILLSIFGDNLVIPSNYFNRGLATAEYLLALPNLTNRVYVGHIWYSDHLAKKLSSIPKIVLIRDPRDNVVSYAHFIDGGAKEVFGPCEEYWTKKNWEDKLSAMIFGITVPTAKIPSVYNSYLNYGIRWVGPNTFLVRYEDLIGTKFGGNDTTVMKTAKRMMDFIGIKIDEDTLARKIARGSDPAKSGTFRSGGEGKWHKEFKPSHVTQMKFAAPNLVSALGYESDENWDFDTKAGKKEDPSEIHIKDDCLENIAIDITRYLQIRKESEGKKELEGLMDEWALYIFIENEQYQDAIPILEQLLNNIQANPKWNYLYAVCLHNLKKDPVKALHHYNAALENGYDEFWVKYNRGALLASLGEKQAATNDLKRALMLAPQHKGTQDVLKSLQVNNIVS